MNCTRPWQPIPATPNDPSGSFVDRLCGQPEQKTGRRASGPTLDHDVADMDADAEVDATVR